MTITITYFVHGTTTDNEQGIATGQMPGRLSKKGIEQSKELGKQLSDSHFDIVFCSDLKRAVDSARYAFQERYDIITDKRLRECDYGKLTGKVFSFDLKRYITTPFPDGESYKDVEKRISSFLSFLKRYHADEEIAVVAHQTPQLALDVLLKGRTWEQAIDKDWRRTKTWRPGWKYKLC